MVPAKEKYFIFEELRNANPMVLHRFVDLNFINNFFKDLNLNSCISKAIISYRKEKVFIYFKPKEFDNVAKEIVNVFVSDPKKGHDINNDIISAASVLIEQNNEFAKTLITQRLSVEELLNIWVEMENKYAQLFKFTWVHNSLDFKDNLFTTYLFDYLDRYIKKNNVDLDINQAFVDLTTPDTKNTYFVKLEKELVKLNQELAEKNVRTVSEIERNSTLDQKLEELAKDFGWLGFGFEGPAWDKKHFFDSAINLHEYDHAEISDRRKIIIDTLGFDSREISLFELSRKVIEGTEFRKEAMFNYYYTLDILFDGLSHELKIPKHYFRYVYPDEISDMASDSVEDELDSRIAGHIDYECNGIRNLLSDKEAHRFLDSIIILPKIGFNGEYLEGQTSFPGIVKGRVKIVNEKSDIEKVNKGDVLVSIATNPELIVAMKKAAAFVTDRGGITCHAAIMSRELKIPCIIGTGIATSVLKDNDEVEVDANNGIIKVLKKHDY